MLDRLGYRCLAVVPPSMRTAAGGAAGNATISTGKGKRVDGREAIENTQLELCRAGAHMRTSTASSRAHTQRERGRHPNPMMQEIHTYVCVCLSVCLSVCLFSVWCQECATWRRYQLLTRCHPVV